MNIIRELKTFNADVTSLEDALALEVGAETLRANYVKHNIPVPEWLDDTARRLARHIETQTREAKELRLKEIKSQRENLATAAEKREKLDAEAAALEAALKGQ